MASTTTRWARALGLGAGLALAGTGLVDAEPALAGSVRIESHRTGDDGWRGDRRVHSPGPQWRQVDGRRGWRGDHDRGWRGDRGRHGRGDHDHGYRGRWGHGPYGHYRGSGRWGGPPVWVPGYWHWNGWGWVWMPGHLRH